MLFELDLERKERRVEQHIINHSDHISIVAFK